MERSSAANQFVPNAELLDRELWTRFAALPNEMIIARGGRRMFPIFRVELFGLNPDKTYFVSMDIINVDVRRHKYRNGEWVIADRGQSHVQCAPNFHFLTPCSGKELMKRTISFENVKLTNSHKNRSAHRVILHTSLRYQPRLIVTPFGEQTIGDLQQIFTFSFPETVFIAVTAYRNPEVTDMKVQTNPFARAFRSDGNKARKITASSGTHQNSSTVSSSSQDETSTEGSQRQYRMQFPEMFSLGSPQNPRQLYEPFSFPTGSIPSQQLGFQVLSDESSNFGCCGIADQVLLQSDFLARIQQLHSQHFVDNRPPPVHSIYANDKQDNNLAMTCSRSNSTEYRGHNSTAANRTLSDCTSKKAHIGHSSARSCPPCGAPESSESDGIDSKAIVSKDTRSDAAYLHITTDQSSTLSQEKAASNISEEISCGKMPLDLSKKHF